MSKELLALKQAHDLGIPWLDDMPTDEEVAEAADLMVRVYTDIETRLLTLFGCPDPTLPFWNALKCRWRWRVHSYASKDSEGQQIPFECEIFLDNEGAPGESETVRVIDPPMRSLGLTMFRGDKYSDQEWYYVLELKHQMEEVTV